MNKTPLIICIAGLSILCFSGCSSTTEVRDRAFIQSVGVDGDKQQTVAIKIFSNEKAELCEGSGETVFSAIEDAEAQQNKNLFIGHIEHLVIGDGNIKERICVLMKNNRITPSCNVVYSKGSAVDLVLEEDKKDVLATMASKARKGLIVEQSMSDVMKKLMSADGTALVPVTDGKSTVMGVINENGLIGVFSEQESIGVCLLNGEFKNNVIPLTTLDGKNIDFWVKNIKKTVKTEIINNRVKAEITFKIEGEKVEAEVTNIDIEKLLSKKITDICSKAVDKSIGTFSSDIFGLETSLKKSQAKFYLQNKDNWNNVLKNTDITYKVELKK